jgi:alpha-D-ribose 1-methylphosphonate 5-triphosphate diphosphatase
LNVSQLALTNAQIVLPERIVQGSVVINGDSLIEEVVIGSRIPRTQTVEDVGGDMLMPGLIDLHGDDIEYEIGAKGAKASPTRLPVSLGLIQSDKNAIGWGITTRYHALAYWEEESKGRSVRLSKEIVETIGRLQSEGVLLGEHFVDLRYEVTGDPSYTLEVMGNRCVRMVSLMDHTPGEGQFKDDAAYRALNKSITGWSDEELDRIIAEKRARQSLKASHVEQVVARARDLGQAVASHDDHTIEKVTRMKGLGIAIAEMPVALDAACEAKRLGMTVTMAAPNVIRGGSSTGNLNAVDAIRAGVLDVLCTDYYLPSLIAAVFRLVRDRVTDLPSAVRLVTLNPARGVGLSDRGEVAAGLRADLVTVRANDATPIVTRTYKGGRLVFRDDRFNRGV